MKTSSLRRWSKALRTPQQVGQASRARRRQTLVLEALEDRVTLSLTPQMVLDINPGIASSRPAGTAGIPWSYPSETVVIGSTAYFTAEDGVHGIELWKSDGTAAGTMLVKDIIPGSASSVTEPSFLTNVNGTLFFTASDGTHGRELWKSDGTAAGTVLVKDIVAGSGSSGPGLLANVNGTLFFRAFDAKRGSELWKSDGTAAGTTLVKDIKPKSGGSGI